MKYTIDLKQIEKCWLIRFEGHDWMPEREWLPLPYHGSMSGREVEALVRAKHPRGKVRCISSGL